MPYDEGDILIVLFPYDECGEEKLRPALFLQYKGNDYLFLSKITSASHNSEWEVEVMPSKENGLTKRSYIRVDRTRKIHYSKEYNVIPIGRLEVDLMAVVKQRFRAFYGQLL